MKKNILICGAGGFIGHNLAKRLSKDNNVTGVDLKYPEFEQSPAQRFLKADLRIASYVAALLDNTWDEIYQLAADMGGAGFVFTGANDAEILHNNALINLNIVNGLIGSGTPNKPKVFYSSSACIYPQENQLDADAPTCAEATAYPANPDSDYGWEKLFSERLYQAYQRNHGLDLRIARFHNIYGPNGTWCGGREKVPAAMIRKALTVQRTSGPDKQGPDKQRTAGPMDQRTIEIWGDGQQTRSFLYIEDCLDAMGLLMESDYTHPINIGSEEMVTINRLLEIAIKCSGVTDYLVNHIDGPQGVRGRCSDNRIIEEVLDWYPRYDLVRGMELTYQWIAGQMKNVQAREL